jgi:hypothetical protein
VIERESNQFEEDEAPTSKIFSSQGFRVPPNKERIILKVHDLYEKTVPKQQSQWLIEQHRSQQRYSLLSRSESQRRYYHRLKTRRSTA